MKKFLLTLVGVICSLEMWADTTYTLKLDNGATQSTANYFTVSTGGGFNSKYTGTYNGTSYTKGLKLNSSSSIEFTTSATSTVTIVQSTTANATNTFKFDGDEVANNTGVANPNDGDANVLVFTISSVAAGNHTIVQNKETGILYVEVTEAAATVPVINTQPTSADYALNATPTALSVSATASSGTLSYQWYSNSSESTEGATAIDEATSASYTPSTATAGATYYYCVVTDANGSTKSSFAKVNVVGTVDAPTFTTYNGTVAIACATEGAKIQYSTDGTNYSDYTIPVTLFVDHTIYAKASVGTVVSEVASQDVTAVTAEEGSSSIILYYNKTDMTAASEAPKGLTGNAGTDYEGWSITLADNGSGTYDKSLSSSTAINEKSTLKGSNGRQLIIGMPSGIKANRITIYSFSATKGYTSLWSEVAGTTYTTSNEIGMTSTDAANPDVRIFPLNDVTGTITLNNSGTQQCFVAVVNYVDTKTASDLTLSSSEEAVLLENTKDVTYTTTSTGTVTVKSSDEAVATAAIDTENKKVTITGVAKGTATITISQEADETYTAGTKTISVTVKDPYAGTVLYDVQDEECTSTANGTASVSDGKYVFANGIDPDNTGAPVNYIKIVPKNGGQFIAGDVVDFTASINNSNTEKVGYLAILAPSEEIKVLFTSEQLKNLNSKGANYAAAAEPQSYTLTDSYSALYIARASSANTGVTVSSITVTRPVTVREGYLNDYGYATFSSNKNIQIEGAQAYTAEISGNTITCHKIENNIVPAYTGVILYSASGNVHYSGLYKESASALSVDNALKATTTSEGTADYESSLVLSGDKFVKYDNTEFTAGKAYFPYTPSAKSFNIVFAGEEATAIANVNAVKAENAAVYNLAGQRVNANVKGLVIVNGKKYMNK